MTAKITLNARAEASRRNGARSRGPVSAEGRACAARNALKHGLRAQKVALLEDEDEAEFLAFSAALHAELAPAGALQEHLVASLALAAWRGRRSDRIEAELYPLPATRPVLAAKGKAWQRGRGGPRARPDPRRQRTPRARHPPALPRLGAGGIASGARRLEGAPGRGGGRGSSGARGPAPAGICQTNPRRALSLTFHPLPGRSG